jgi:hypothetical protein
VDVARHRKLSEPASGFGKSVFAVGSAAKRSAAISAHCCPFGSARNRGRKDLAFMLARSGLGDRHAVRCDKRIDFLARLVLLEPVGVSAVIPSLPKEP